MRYKRQLAILFSLVLLTTLSVGYFTKRVEAGCKCVSTGTTDQKAGTWIKYDDGTAPPNDGCASSGGGSGSCTNTDPTQLTCGTCNPLTEAKIGIWFRVPSLGDLIGNVIRLIFFIAGLYALVLLLLGGFEWVSSGGEEKKLTSARGKIMNAIIGLVVMVAVLTLVILLEQVVFGGKVCLGISCPINMGDLRIIK